MNLQTQRYFGLQVIGIVYQVLSGLLQVSDIKNLESGDAQEVVDFNDRVFSDIIAKAILGSITKTSLQRLGLHQKKYEWGDSRGIIRSDGPTMLYILLKIIKPATRTGVSILKD